MIIHVEERFFTYKGKRYSKQFLIDVTEGRMRELRNLISEF